MSIEKNGGILAFSVVFVTMLLAFLLSFFGYKIIKKIEPSNNSTQSKYDIHSIVSNNGSIFNDKISINWKDYKIDNRKRRSLKKHQSEMGISVSEFQNEINWKKVKKDGIDYALIRVGSRGYLTGKIRKDKRFKKNMDGASKNNIKIGVYFYSQAINKKEMDEEIKIILKSIKDYSLDYPVAISMERVNTSLRTTRTSVLPDKDYIALIKYFCIRMKKKGYTPMIMEKTEWFEQFQKDTFNGYLKMASSKKSPPNNITNCVIWEYDENAKEVVNGISTDVELSLSAYIDEQDKMK